LDGTDTRPEPAVLAEKRSGYREMNPSGKEVHAISHSHFAEYGLRKLQIQPVGAASSRDRTPAGSRIAATSRSHGYAVE